MKIAGYPVVQTAVIGKRTRTRTRARTRTRRGR